MPRPERPPKQIGVIRVVLGTNVMVSGLLFGGTPGRLIDLWKVGSVRPVMSGEMLDELLRVNIFSAATVIFSICNPTGESKSFRRPSFCLA